MNLKMAVSSSLLPVYPEKAWNGSGEFLWQKMNGIKNCLIKLAVPGFEADFIWPKKILVI